MTWVTDEIESCLNNSIDFLLLSMKFSFLQVFSSIDAQMCVLSPQSLLQDIDLQ